jgi:hypothetical protein
MKNKIKQKPDVSVEKVIITKEDLGYATESVIVTDEMVRAVMIPKEYFG